MRKFAFDNSPAKGDGGCSARTSVFLLLIITVFSIGLACADGKDSSTNKGPDRQSLPTPNSTGTPSASNTNGANNAPVQPRQ